MILYTGKKFVICLLSSIFPLWLHLKFWWYIAIYMYIIPDTPHFTMEPQDVIITMGNTAYFSCRAEGNENYKISWLHNE